MKVKFVCALIALSLGWIVVLRHLNANLQGELSDAPQRIPGLNESFSFRSLFHKDAPPASEGNSGMGNNGGADGSHERLASEPSSARAREEEFGNGEGGSSSWRDLLTLAQSETDADRKAAAIDHAARTVSEADLPATLDTLLKSANPDAAELRQRLVRRWVEADAPSAATWAANLGESPSAREVVMQVAVGWAGTDSAAAVRWANELPDGATKQAAVLSLSYEIARTQPMAALDLASSLPPSLDRDNLLVHAISQWASSDSYGATAWAQRISDLILQQKLLGAVAVAVSDQNAVAAATLAAKSLGTGIEQDRAVVAIVQRWAERSPAEAASWLAQFPDTPARDAAAQNLVFLWTLQDKDAPRNWLQQLPQGSLRTVGLMAYSQAMENPSQTAPGLTRAP